CASQPLRILFAEWTNPIRAWPLEWRFALAGRLPPVGCTAAPGRILGFPSAQLLQVHAVRAFDLSESCRHHRRLLAHFFRIHLLSGQVVLCSWRKRPGI